MSNQPRESRSTPSNFYVNYLPVPAALRRTLWQITLVAPSVLAVFVVAWALSQRSPGTAVWDTATPVVVEGILVTRPAPMIFTDDGQAVLLVEVGKIGAGPRCAPFDGLRVRASGWPLTRDGRRLLELEPQVDNAPNSLAPTPTLAVVALPPIHDLGPLTLRGEIVDAKCFLGAMKPGDGKAHKDCATLCIRGGIPAIFIASSPDGARSYYLIQSPDGGPIDPALHALIADPVEITGHASVRGGLRFITLKPGAARRL